MVPENRVDCKVNTEATGVLTASRSSLMKGQKIREPTTHQRKQTNSLARTQQMFDDLQVKVKKHSAVFNRQLMMKHRSIISKRLKAE